VVKSAAVFTGVGTVEVRIVMCICWPSPFSFTDKQVRSIAESEVIGVVADAIPVLDCVDALSSLGCDMSKSWNEGVFAGL
jgi:hypothetical protein